MVNFNLKKTIKNPINLSLHKDFPSFLLFRENREKRTKKGGADKPVLSFKSDPNTPSPWVILTDKFDYLGSQTDPIALRNEYDFTLVVHHDNQRQITGILQLQTL